MPTPSNMDHPHNLGGAEEPSYGGDTVQHHAPVHKESFEEAADGARRSQVHDSGASSAQIKQTATGPPPARVLLVRGLLCRCI